MRIKFLSKNYSKCRANTTKRRLRQHNLFGWRPAKKPLTLLRNPNEIFKRFLHWTSKEWSKVLFSDESKFCMFGSNGIKYVRRPTGKIFAPKYQMPTVKHGGGNIMVWGSFSSDSICPLHCIEGIMDQNVYLDVIKNFMLPHERTKCLVGWNFLKNSDLKHRANPIKNFFNSKKIDFWTSLLKALI